MITIDGGTGKVLHNGVDIASRKMIDQWRRTTSLSTSNSEDFLTSGWERVDSSGQGVCIPGGGMSESSGIFTFPMTGIYKVEWQAYAEDTDGSISNAVNVYVTTDNSSYNTRSSTVFALTDSAGSGTYEYAAGHTQTLVDVTDVSQVKVKFRVRSSGSVTWDVSSNENRNCATFTRIGDT